MTGPTVRPQHTPRSQPAVSAQPQWLPEEKVAELDEQRGVTHRPAAPEHTALDLLEDEDRTILRLSAEVDRSRRQVEEGVGGERVEARADYGNEAKLLVRHFATREAAAVDVAAGLQAVGQLGDVAGRLLEGEEMRRSRMDRVERMSRGVQGMYLNTAQDFDGELSSLMAAVRPQLEWELEEGIPTVRDQLGGERCAQLFHSAEHVARHAPTHVAPDGPRWYERAPLVSRLLTVVHHLRDYPRASRDART